MVLEQFDYQVERWCEAARAPQYSGFPDSLSISILKSRERSEKYAEGRCRSRETIQMAKQSAKTCFSLSYDCKKRSSQ